MTDPVISPEAEEKITVYATHLVNAVCAATFLTQALSTLDKGIKFEYDAGNNEYARQLYKIRETLRHKLAAAPHVMPDLPTA